MIRCREKKINQVLRVEVNSDKTLKSTNQKKKNYFLDYIKFKDFGPRKTITGKSKIGGILAKKNCSF